MRNSFVDFLMKKVEGGQAENTVVVTGDLGFSVLEPLKKSLGKRFINAGVAEALMTSVAAGIASQGFKVFTYSITPFATFRCLEQIRNDVCYHNLDVTVVGIGAGFGYGPLGPTHHALEDLSALWALPRMKVYHPADIREAQVCFEHCWTESGPKYLRLGKGKEGQLGVENLVLEELGSRPVIEYEQGKDFSLIATGNILKEVLEASQALAHKGVRCQVLSCPLMKPFSSEEFLSALTSNSILVIEELSPYGGFSSLISKVILQGGLRVKNFSVLSPPDLFAQEVGGPEVLRKWAGISSSHIVEKVLDSLRSPS